MLELEFDSYACGDYDEIWLTDESGEVDDALYVRADKVDELRDMVGNLWRILNNSPCIIDDRCDACRDFRLDKKCGRGCTLEDRIRELGVPLDWV